MVKGEVYIVRSEIEFVYKRRLTPFAFHSVKLGLIEHGKTVLVTFYLPTVLAAANVRTDVKIII